MIKKYKDLNTVFENRIKYRQPIRKPLLLISQIQRSGGTLMSQLFDGHSELHVHPGELNIGRPKKWHYPEVDLRLKSKEIYKLYNEERQTSEYIEGGYLKQGKGKANEETDTIIKSHPFIFSTQLQKNLFDIFMKDFKASCNRDVLDAYVSSYFNSWMDYQDLYKVDSEVKYWCTFCARLAVFENNPEKIFRDFPEGKILTMFRNPASWYASAMRHADRYNNLTKSMNLWVKTYQNALKYKEMYPKNMFLIDFDQLLKDVPAFMKDLSGLLGIKYEDVLGIPTFNRMRIASDSSFGVKIGIDKSAGDRKKYLTPEQAEEVEKISTETYNTLKNQAWEPRP